jgi:YgiT-type zinc finger domain-containing protein
MTTERQIAIRKMLDKAKEKLTTAKIDYDAERYDDSVSRAYYAAFHAISAVLLSRGLHFSSHSQTIGSFNKEFIRHGHFPVDFTKNIQKLFNDRQTGDYDYGECEICDTHLQEKFIKQDFWIRGKLIVVDNVQAGVCPQCGAKVVSSDIGRHVSALLGSSEKIAEAPCISVPVSVLSCEQ